MNDKPRQQVHATTDPRHSMALLARLLEADEPAYQRASLCRSEQPEPPRRHLLGQVATGLSGVAIGVVLVMGALHLKVPDPAAEEHHTRLEEQVRGAQARVSDQEREISTLSHDITLLQEKGRQGVDQSLNTSIADAAALAGHTDVTGEGIVLTLDDRSAYDSGAVSSRNGRGIAPERIHSDDMLAFVNVLWGSGAEAISINGHRLTSLSTIRFAGEALIVDFSPLARPYEVRAIGPSQALSDACSSGTVSHLRTELTEYGVVVSVRPEKRIFVPGGSAGSLWNAQAGVPDSLAAPTTTTRGTP